MLQKMAQMQNTISKIQKELAEAVFEGSGANGLVKVSMKGTGEMVSLNISPEMAASLVKENDIETLEDVVMAAFRSAYTAKENATAEKMKTLGKLPFGMKLPGL